MTSGSSDSGDHDKRRYRVVKKREKWSADEQARFVEALKFFGRDWKKITEHVRSKTRVQVRSHAQKYFLKLEKTKSQDLRTDYDNDTVSTLSPTTMCNDPTGVLVSSEGETDASSPDGENFSNLYSLIASWVDPTNNTPFSSDSLRQLHQTERSVLSSMVDNLTTTLIEQQDPAFPEPMQGLHTGDAVIYLGGDPSFADDFETNFLNQSSLPLGDCFTDVSDF